MKNIGKIISLISLVFMLLNAMIPTITYALEPIVGEAEMITTDFKIEAEKEWDISQSGDGSAIAKWKYSDRSLTISGNGMIKRIDYGMYKDLVETIIIEDGITAIGESVFANFTSVKSVFLADSIIEVGKNAFTLCENLEELTLPPHIKSIDNILCNSSKVTEFIIPNEVETISITGFIGCGTTSLYIPASVKTIITDNSKNNIKTVHVDENNQYYKDIDGVVYDKEVKTLISYPAGKEDETYVIPDSVTKIGDYAFANNEYIKKLVLPETVEEIGKGAFSGCYSLEKINLPSGITSIKEYTFYECGLLSGIILPEGITSLGEYAFEGCSSLESINIPIGVSEIPNNCFMDCSSLKNVEFTTGLRRIFDGAFSHCSSLAEINLPNGLNYVQENAFDSDMIIKIYIPNSLAQISFIQFNDGYYPTTIICETNSAAHDYAETHQIHYILTDDGEEDNIVGSEYKLEKTKTWDVSEDAAGEDRLLLTWDYDDSSLTLSGKGKMKEEIPYVDYLGLAKKVIIETGEKELASEAFPSPTIKEVIISRDYKYDENNERIPEPIDLKDAFNRCWFLEKLVLSKDIYSMEIDFGEKFYLKEIDYDGEGQYVIIDDIVYSYDLNTIYKCLSNEAEITIPNTVKKIETGAFRKCENLEKIIIPDSVETIENNAFYDCINLKEVQMSNNLKKLGESVFYNCKTLKSIELPDTIQRYGTELFKNCYELDNIVWPENMNSIKQGTFEGCISLKNIQLPETLTSIGLNSFAYCRNLKDIQLPDAVNEIGYSAFIEAGFKNINLPSNLSFLRSSAFRNCKDLETIEIPNGVKTIDSNTFDGCSKLKSIKIPKGVTEIKVNAFDNCTSLETIDLAEENETYIVKDGALYRLEDNCLMIIPLNYKNSVIEEDVDTFAVGSINNKNMVIVKKNTPAHKYAEMKNIAYLLWNVDAKNYDMEDGLIGKINPNTKVSNLGEIIDVESEEIKFISSDGNELKENDVIGTNGKIILYNKIAYNFVVKGDLSGDGLVTVKDLALIQRKILDDEFEIDDLAFKAADKNGDDSITVTDLAAVQRYILTGTVL